MVLGSVENKQVVAVTLDNRALVSLPFPRLQPHSATMGTLVPIPCLPGEASVHLDTKVPVCMCKLSHPLLLYHRPLHCFFRNDTYK